MSTNHRAGTGRRVRKTVLAAIIAGFAVAGAGTSYASGDILSDNLSDNLICGQAISVGSSGDTNGDCPDDGDDDKHY